MPEHSIEDMERLSVVSRLERPVKAGDTVIRFRAVLDGVAGETFLIDPFSVYNETVTVSSYDRRDATLSTGLSYAHGPDTPVVRKKFAEFLLIYDSLTNPSMSASSLVGATSIAVTNKPNQLKANACWVVIDPYTIECEIRRVTNIVGLTLTIGALAYAHSQNDPILIVNEPVVNVAWFGVTFEDATAKAANSVALQRALDQSMGSGVNYYTTYYFPGLVHVDASMNMTNRRYWKFKAGAWEAGGVVSYATGKPAIDLLGARFFDIAPGFVVSGDATNTPSVLLFFGRTVTGPNCGNCFIDGLCLGGKASSAAIYAINSEVISITRLRSTGNGVDTPYVFYASVANDLAITSDYETLSFVFTGYSIIRLKDWWVTTVSGGYASNGIYLKGNCSSIVVRDIYMNLYGGTGFLLTLAGPLQISGIIVDDISCEGSWAGVMKLDNATVRSYKFHYFSWVGFSSINSSTLERGKFENVIGGASGATWTFETINYSRILNWWNFSNQNLTAANGTGNVVEKPGSTSVITFTAGSGNQTYQVSGSPYPVTLPTINVGDGGNITKILKVTESLDFGSIAAGAFGDITVTATGAAYGNLAIASPRTAIEAGLIHALTVAEANSVRIRLYNTTGAPIDPAAREWTVTVFA